MTPQILTVMCACSCNMLAITVLIALAKREKLPVGRLSDNLLCTYFRMTRPSPCSILWVSAEVMLFLQCWQGQEQTRLQMRCRWRHQKRRQKATILGWWLSSVGSLGAVCSLKVPRFALGTISYLEASLCLTSINPNSEMTPENAKMTAKKKISTHSKDPNNLSSSSLVVLVITAAWVRHK